MIKFDLNDIIPEEEFNLSDKRQFHGNGITKYYPEEDVKEKIQNAQKRIKSIGYIREEDYIKEINKIFLEEFGKELLEEKG